MEHGVYFEQFVLLDWFYEDKTLTIDFTATSNIM